MFKKSYGSKDSDILLTGYTLPINEIASGRVDLLLTSLPCLISEESSLIPSHGRLMSQMPSLRKVAKYNIILNQMSKVGSA